VTVSERPAPATGTGPSENAAAKPPLTAHSRARSVESAPLSTVTPLPLAWARQLIARGGTDVPRYGTSAWMALDDRDPRKVAACVQAAEAWRTRHHRDDTFPEAAGNSRARRVAAARQPRPSDHPGGPVFWDRRVAGV
jgi:hypothetical protein